MITGLTHIAVLVSDIDRSIEFYTNILGLSEKFRLNNDNGEPILVYIKVAQRQFIELFPGGEGTHDIPKTPGMMHICLEVDDIHETYKEMTSRGLVAWSEPTYAMDNAWQFWTNDPDGNPIEFHQFTEESMQL